MKTYCRQEISRGDIYYADLRPVIGSEQGGIRPVLILQNNVGNRHSPTVIAAPITSKMGKPRLPTHVCLNRQANGLSCGSVILLEQLRTIDKSRLRERVGALDCALPGFVDSKNEEKTERNAGYLVVSHSGGGMLRQGTRKGIRRTPANRGMRAHWVVKGLDISEDVCHGMCP